jgi:hypothetical protein
VRTTNILDPVRNELDPRVFDNPASDKPVLKPTHAHWIKSQIYKTLEDGSYTDVEKWLTLVLTGSICTYQYSDSSDIDVSLFIDSRIFPEWSRAEMIALMVDKMDGRMLPGTQFPMQDFVVGEGIKPSDLYKPGLRSGYNLDNNKWIVPPERSQAHDVKTIEGGFYAWGLQMADKMERLLRYEPDAAIAFWHSIHNKRRIDMQKGKGNFAESNIIYKMLANRGLFPALSQASGEYIAKKVPEPPNYQVGSLGKHCSNCKMYDHGQCWGYGNKKVKAEWVCDSWADEHKTTKIAAPFDRQVAKFAYDPFVNHILLGEMGKEEGEMLSHNQLAENDIWEDPQRLIYGQVNRNGWAQSQGRPMIFPGGPKSNYMVQYQAEEALRRAVPGTKFTNPRDMLRPEWAIDDPKITYVGEPPTVQPTDEVEKRWNFQAKIDANQVAQRIYEKAIEGAGSAINLHGEEPHTRFGFAPDLATQTPFSLATFNPADVEAFIQRFADRLTDPEKFVGSWIQGDQVILDVTEGHDDFDTAHQRAWDGHQLALYDSVAKEDISVRGLDYEQPTTEV